jgi:hypothetical protein
MTMATFEAGGRDREILPGHGTAALGPSDSSDTGSDIAGGAGLGRNAEPSPPLATGTNSDEHVGTAITDASAGADIGDSALTSDTDAAGTGERVAAGRDAAEPLDRDRDFHRLVSADDPSLGLTDGVQAADGHTLETGEVAEDDDETIELDGGAILDQLESDLAESEGEANALAKDQADPVPR